jgi:putative transposase
VLDDFSRYIVAWELCQGMKAEDAQRTVEKAILNAGVEKDCRPKLLCDNGSSYIASQFNDFLREEKIQVVHGRPLHPQTQGKIERYNRSLKNVVKLENYYSPEELERAVESFVEHYNYHRYHEAIDNLTPAQKYYHQATKILQQRKVIKEKTLKKRRELHQKAVATKELVT